MTPVSGGDGDSDRPPESPATNSSSPLVAAHSAMTPTTPAVTVKVPKFLSLSRMDISKKYHELDWAQRTRFTQASLNPDTPSRWARMSGDETHERNRYANVEPFSVNRIRLRVPSEHNDYINASPIILQSRATGEYKTYIATQGPKADSYSHIWRMVWHETGPVAVIVMLTQCHESGREKCFQYFPASMADPILPINEHDEFDDGFVGSVTLEDILTDIASRSTVRKLRLEKAGQSKLVWHLLFEAWPDFYIPEGDARAALLELIKLSDRLNTSAPPTSTPSDTTNNNNHEAEERCPEYHDATSSQSPSPPPAFPPNTIPPRIIHCSAGVGRSGTFIALDYLLNELRHGALDEIPDSQDRILETVDALRQQRMMMVQTETQFTFVYAVMREQWLLHHAMRPDPRPVNDDEDDY